MNFFYKTGVDITSDKQMFSFLKTHYTYWVENPWNRLETIANNVKLHSLNLSGDWVIAKSLLDRDGYQAISQIIGAWEDEHRGYTVYFNGRSLGHLVLSTDDYLSVLPDYIKDSDTYEEYKSWCHAVCGSVKANRSELVAFTKLVQSFDLLCDAIRNYVDDLSNEPVEKVWMLEAVGDFNATYGEDLKRLGFSSLSVDDDGIVDISEIKQMRCLHDAFVNTTNRFSGVILDHVCVAGRGYAFMRPRR